MTVHDEIVIQVPIDQLLTEVPILKSAMEDQPGWDVPFVAEVEFGPNWHKLTPLTSKSIKEYSEVGRQHSAGNRDTSPNTRM